MVGDLGTSANTVSKACNAAFQQQSLSLSPQMPVPVLVVRTAEINLFAVLVGDNVVLHVHKSLSEAYNRLAQAPPA